VNISFLLLFSISVVFTSSNRTYSYSNIPGEVPSFISGESISFLCGSDELLVDFPGLASGDELDILAR
jgi:hypothetical protein